MGSRDSRHGHSVLLSWWLRARRIVARLTGLGGGGGRTSVVGSAVAGARDHAGRRTWTS
jgi:hypothetical protein